MAGETVWRRRAPIWLRVVAGLVAFPLLWLVAALICVELLQGSIGGEIPAGLLILAAIIGVLASFFLCRRSSLPVAGILIALPLFAYGLAYYGLQGVGNAEKPFGTATEQAPPGEPEMAPSMAEPSGGGGGPHYETETPATPEDEMAAPQAQPAPPAAADGEAHYEMGELPEFPWPPPQASASYVLPDRLLVSYHTVGEVVAAIIGALEQKGYVERSFFRTEAGGVALVTRLERINDDGTPSAETDRWPNSGEHYASRESLFQFLQGLFYVDPGHYRVIVFVLQDLPFSQSSTNISADEAKAWLISGANVLPAEIASRPFGGANGGHCTALIYEFASDGTKVHVVDSRLTGKEHLEKAGLLAALGTHP